MDTTFYILLHCRTPTGWVNYARYELGCEPAFAYEVFAELDGFTDAKEADTLTMELMETKAGLPLNVKILSCTLNQLSSNCRHLAKEIFKHSALKS